MLIRYRNQLIAAGRSTGTVKQRILHVQHFSRAHDLIAATEDDLSAYLASKADTHAAESRKAIRASLRSFYTWAHRRGYTSSNPAAELEAISIPRTIARTAPDDDLQAALITATLEQQAMIMLARFGCLRLNELTTLHMSQRRGDLLHIIGKGGKHRYVPINPELMNVLLQLERHHGGGYYFPGRFAGYMHPTAVGKIVTRLTGWNPHSLRHAGATAAYNATGDLRAVQELLGHASLETTQRYLHTSLPQLRAVAAATAFARPYSSPHFPVAA